MPRVVVACGSGLVTSQLVASKLGRLLAKRGVRAQMDACSVNDLARHLPGAAAYVSVVKADGQASVPVFNGMAFLTGTGQEEELSRLVMALRG